MNICVPEYVLLVSYLFVNLTKGDKTETSPKMPSLKTNLNDLTFRDEATSAKINSIPEPSLGGSIDQTKYYIENRKETTESINVQTKINMNDFRVSTLKDNNFDRDDADSEANCLASVSPKKIEAVRRTLKSDGGRVKFVSADQLPITDEEIKIASCFNKDSTNTKAKDKTENTEFDTDNTNKNDFGSVKGANNLDTETVGETNATKTRISNETSQRRDYEYKFESLQYYDEPPLDFTVDMCPDAMDIIYLQIAEVKHYDLECELLTKWTSLTDAFLYLNID